MPIGHYNHIFSLQRHQQKYTWNQVWFDLWKCHLYQHNVLCGVLPRFWSNSLPVSGSSATQLALAQLLCSCPGWVVESIRLKLVSLWIQKIRIYFYVALHYNQDNCELTLTLYLFFLQKNDGFSMSIIVTFSALLGLKSTICSELLIWILLVD